ncbi:MAG TPA: disulfide bond formation protein B [Gammaproteobacteria bacterium]|nr:disulfide bond formation protein B [Gammaproteobacteria bacterium]
MISNRLHRRLFNLAGVLAVVGLMAYALYEQYVVGLEACPLCIFQRVALITLGVVFLVAALHGPVGRGARGYAGLGAVVALVGAGISAWHVHIQNLPDDAVPSCGPGLAYMFDAFSVPQAIKMVFTGSGECHAVNWKFLGLSMPGWVLIWFVLLGALIVYANWSPLAERRTQRARAENGVRPQFPTAN